MPRYYFHISSYGQRFRDDQGAELKELSDAHAYGVKLQQRLAEYCEGSHDFVRIADEFGEIKLILLPWRARGFIPFVWRSGAQG